MPFYAMPTLGGNDTLRGFREYRFRGPARHPHAGRVSVGDLERSRRRVVLQRQRQGARTAAGILDFDNLESDYGSRIPVQHERSDRVSRGCGLWESRWQACLHRLWRRLLAADFADSADSSSPRSARSSSDSRRRPGPPGRGSIRTIRSGQTTTARSMRRRSSTIEDTGGLRLRHELVRQAGRPPRRSRVERQYGRRGAGLELVHEPDRPPRMTVADVVKGPDTIEGVSLDGWVVSRRQAHGIPAGLPDDRIPTARFTRLKWIAPRLSRARERRGDYRHGVLPRHRIQRGRDLRRGDRSEHARHRGWGHHPRSAEIGQRRKMKKYDLDDVLSRPRGYPAAPIA